MQDELKIADQKGVVLAAAVKENITAVKEATNKNQEAQKAMSKNKDWLFLGLSVLVLIGNIILITL